ncbi:polysaccharide deacetylase family protein [Halomarina oriensis]|uniref:Polysaccharide deacetylase family protein n=1 Tax=Halomarina oriensis TaxID=671145 RepID=A0A6B0GSL9_9EURY|nr:polysaccharide deacetylase family protein [Halomarina oriensis]MWG36699.1 polysaccharide deacetylase family protein [Halomarina oriensis]
MPPSDAGHLVLTFDDGYAADHDLIRPVLAERDARAVFAVVPSWVGKPGHLTAVELDALVDAGHEVAAHGRRHRYLQALRLGRDATSGDDDLHVAGEVHDDEDCGIVVGDRYEVTDGDHREPVEIAAVSATEDGGVLTLAASLDSAFDRGETVVRPHESVVTDEIRGVRAAFAEMGSDPSSFVLPYGAADTRAWRAVHEEYDVLANAAIRSLPNPPGTAPTNLRRYYLETTHLTRVELGEYLDAVAETGGIGVLAGHSAWQSVTAERVGWVVGAARERGVEVTTFASLFG